MALAFLHPRVQLQRPARDDQGRESFFGGAFITYPVSSSPEQFTSGQLFTPNNRYTGAGRASIATPPLHWHLYQSETFDVKAGTLGYIIDGKQGTLQAGQKVSIPPFKNHTFWNASDTESLDVHITVRGGQNPGFDETFVRNFYGYLSSVTMQGEFVTYNGRDHLADTGFAGKSPSLFQMLVFLYNADVVLAEMPFARAANYVLGHLIGEKLLGLQPHYKEFEDD
ncbi:hypothetical protein OIV83_000112 [Microbotryomycetes sp. JL201]|nr:hypothetical protein OIV83_000112 [Microbotryomycetes sp. JL201]